jgi:hypothetical protein
MSGPDVVGICDACGFGPVLCTEQPRSATLEPSTKKLCALCRRTIVGRLEDGYGPTHSIREHEHVLRTINYVGNAILAHLEQLYRR